MAASANSVHLSNDSEQSLLAPSLNSSIDNGNTSGNNFSSNNSSFVNDTSGASNQSRRESTSSNKIVVPAELDYGIINPEDAYKLAREFVKSKGGSKAVQISYNDRNLMNVLAKIVNNYKFEDEKNKVGILDMVGKDRVQLWKSLGDVPREEAMKKYINLVMKVCPLFYAHFEAHKRHLEEQEQQMKKLLEEEERKKKEMTEQKEKKTSRGGSAHAGRQ